MSTRDLPAMRTLTWIADVQSGMGPEWAKQFDPWFDRLDWRAGRKARHRRLRHHGAGAAAAVRRSLGERVRLASRRRSGRRSVAAQTAARTDDDAGVVQGGSKPRPKTFVESWRGNHAPETAALDAERFARSHAAQDVRTLVSLDGGRTLVPFQGRFEKCDGPLVGYIAVKTLGYWADMFVTASDGAESAAERAAGAALDALIASIRPGVAASDLHAKAVARWRPTSFIPSSAAASATASVCRCTKAPNSPPRPTRR